jgi:Glycosyltransferases involved in cell wall biogenesis
MSPDSVTPMILAWNEAANIRRCLSALRWARRVVVVDSFSDDATRDICGEFSNVEIVQRRFDSFARQANFGLSQIRTEWVLSLDADYVVPGDWCERMEALSDADVAGYSTPFTYCVFGRALRGTVYPPRTVLYRRASALYEDDGHTQRVKIDGRVERLDARIAHDDRKPLARWFASQARYVREEADKFELTTSLSFPDRVRRAIVFAPGLMFGYCLLVRGCIFEGWPGWYYAMQRACAEMMLSIELLDRRLRGTDR